MQITGPKTHSVDRDHIVAPENLRAATAWIAARAGGSGLQQARRVRSGEQGVYEGGARGTHE